MGFTELGTPVTSSNGDDGELGEDDSASNGGCDFLCTFNTEPDVAVKVTDCDEGLETGTLTGTGLLLDGHDFHDLVLKFWEEKVDDLVLLDWEREEVDLFHGFDFTVFYETTEFGDGLPGRTEIRFDRMSGRHTTPSPRLCGPHDGDPYAHGHDHRDHVQNHRVRVLQRQPFLFYGSVTASYGLE
jgi:hypothetical protein